MLPDFLVVGAMKSGTTTLCSLLARHPAIVMSKRKEPFFFDRDDFVTHPNFFSERQQEWRAFDWNRDRERLVREYEEFFEESANDNALYGEGSTTYLASAKAPKRIAQIIPDAKLIVMLRNPVDRAYSNYWHLVSSGRAVYTFERQIRYEPSTVLQRGLYRSQIEQFLKCFPREQMHFILFESFVKAMQVEVNGVCSFLGVDGDIDVAKLRTHKKAARTPRSHRLQLVLNTIARSIGAEMLSPNLQDDDGARQGRLPSLIKRAQRWNSGSGRYPTMPASTRAFLESFYQRENQGLCDLIDIDTTPHWGWRA